MNFARFLREGRADMLGIGLNLLVEPLEKGVCLPAFADRRRTRSPIGFFRPRMTAGAIGALLVSALPQLGQEMARASTWVS